LSTVENKTEITPKSGKPPGYNIVKAGKKIVGALSYFGGFTGST
jgi:hypothetical protein